MNLGSIELKKYILGALLLLIIIFNGFALFALNVWSFGLIIILILLCFFDMESISTYITKHFSKISITKDGIQLSINKKSQQAGKIQEELAKKNKEQEDIFKELFTKAKLSNEKVIEYSKKLHLLQQQRDKLSEANKLLEQSINKLRLGKEYGFTQEEVYQRSIEAIDYILFHLPESVRDSFQSFAYDEGNKNILKKFPPPETIKKEMLTLGYITSDLIITEQGFHEIISRIIDLGDD